LGDVDRIGDQPLSSEAVNQQDSQNQRVDDAHTTEQLLADALLGDSDDEKAWAAIRALHVRGSRDVFDAALLYTRSADPGVRSRGADILAQLGVPVRAFPDECVTALISLLETDGETAVIAAAATALSHYRDPRVLPALVVHRRHAHESVRLGVAIGLLGWNQPAAIDALIELSVDSASEVRNWATFGLGSQLDADTPAIRDALLHRATDSDGEMRGEALVGLAVRNDRRVIPHVISELERDDVSRFGLQAAAILGDRTLLPTLRALEARRPDIASDVVDAIARCSGEPTDTSIR
jgi:HEAT repeat protein